MEQTSTENPSPDRQARTENTNRTAFWVLLSVSVGFLLPVCSCALLIAVSITSLGMAGRDTPITGRGDAVAIVRVEGIITASDRDQFTAGAPSGTVVADLNKAAEDPTVRAIVLRVDSPGGTVTGSAQIYETIRELEKPVVVSMFSVAASGGYYVSAPADYIFARPDTLTGSIGVIYTFINAEELLERLGVDVTTVTSGPNKEFGSLWRDLTPEQLEIVEQLVAETYEEFVRVVAEGRNIDPGQVGVLADGRIFSGRQALAHGLVDELGDLDNAIAKAAELGGIVGEPRIVEYERLPTFTQLFRGFSSRLGQSQSAELLNLIHEFSMPALEYRYVGPGPQ